MEKSINQYGVKVPLVVTADGWILSGHRRYAAAKMAGLEVVPCQTEPIHRTDDPDKFLVLLREYNRQRVKSLDEQLREEVVSADPSEAYQSLIEYRQKKADEATAGAETLEIIGSKRRSRISPAKQPFLDAIRKVLKERRKFWPLSDRGIHYALLNDPPLIHASKPESRYRNTRQSYKALVDLLTRARLVKLIPMQAISDETRPVICWDVHAGVQPFLRAELASLFKGYWRNLMQSQPNHVEILVEKNTVAPIIKTVAAKYRIPLTSGRGFCSLPPRQAIAQRFAKSGKERLVLLIVSDFDPEGEQIAQSFASSMRDDFLIAATEAVKVALTAQQVEELALPPEMKAKTTSVNYPKFSAKHGDDVFELEAIPPTDLQGIMRAAIDEVIDVEAFNAELDCERDDAAFLENTRRRVNVALSGVLVGDLTTAA
ncbi:MAG: ParB N-terminal domain-containing protein [Isosphaeraceae bacterium]